jgi:uncharacterized protein (DUF2267 family)
MANDDALNGFYQYVKEEGNLRTVDHAHRWSAATLKTLGLNLDRGTKKKLAAALPDELAESLTRVFWLLHFRNPNLSSLEFQRQVARRSGHTDARFARYPVMAVFGGVKQMIDADLEREVAETLSPELREMWQQA